MATTTPNFGWPVPTSTDLVKDGATAIEGLGDAIDASLLDLKGGTTNQVLAKNSNTDMDFKWVSDATGMTNPMTTTGDTIYSSSGSTPARLAIGTTGQVLTVAGGLPTWATPAGGGGGKVLQVIQGSTTTETGIASTSYSDTTLTASITPSSTSSKILVIVAQASGLQRSSGSANGCQIRLLRGATTLMTNTKVVWLSVGGASNCENYVNASIVYLDSPSSTSALTYKTQGAAWTATSGQALFQPADDRSTITLLEIGA